jgi:hypothetical protein
MLRDRNRIIYLQMTLIGLFVGCLLTWLKMFYVDWGEHFLNVWGKQITINDLWYYNVQNASFASFACAIGSMATYCCEIVKPSILAFVVKYVTVFIALVFVSSFFFGLLFYNNITIFEEISFVLLLIYTTFRGSMYYKSNIKGHGAEHITA